MKKPRIGWTLTVVLLIATIFLLCVIGQIGRLVHGYSVDISTAAQLVESLEEKYPKYRFTGGAGIEHQININVYGDTDLKVREEIRNWLLEQRTSRHVEDRWFSLSFYNPNKSMHAEEVYYLNGNQWERRFSNDRWTDGP